MYVLILYNLERDDITKDPKKRFITWNYLDTFVEI